MVKFMKKLAGAMVLVIFMMSIVPMAVADEVDGVEVATVDAVAVDSIEEVDTVEEVDEEVKPRDRLKEKRDKVREHRADAQDKRRALAGRAVEVRDNFKDARERFAAAKERYTDARDKHREHKTRLLDIREKVRDCRADSAECEQHKSDLREGVKEHLLKTIDVIQNSLDRVASHIEEAERLTDEEKDNALERIAELQADLETDAAAVDALGDDSTSEEYRSVIADVKETAKDAKALQKRLVNSVVKKKLDRLVDRHDHVLESMDTRIDRAQENGADTTTLEGIRDDFAAHVDNLKAHHDEAVDLCGEERGTDECRAAQQQVREDVTQSKEILREFVTEFRELRRDAVSDEATTDEE